MSTAKAAPQQDTAEIDLLDGQLYTMIIDLNEAARRAIRQGKLLADKSEYRLHHIRKQTEAEDADTPKTEQEATPATP